MPSLRPLTVASLLLAPACLLAARADDPMEWSEFLQDVADEAKALRDVLVVVDGVQPGPLATEVRALLAQDPLIELNLAFRALPRAGAGQRLAGRSDWGPEARWALLDARGGIRCSGTTAPSAQALAAQLEAAGYQSQAARLRALITRHPDHVEAKAQLVRQELAVAQARFGAFLKAPDLKKGEPAGPVALGRVLTRPLSTEEEERIWGSSRRALDHYFRDDRWPLAVHLWASSLPVEARHCPSMQSLAQRHLQTVEEALIKAPEVPDLWTCWVAMSGAAGHLSLKRVTAPLAPLPPDLSKGPIPSDKTTWSFMQVCREIGAWAELRDFLAVQVAHAKDPSSMIARMVGAKVQAVGLDQEAFGDRWVPLAWAEGQRALIEALLRLGQASQAESLLADLATRPGGADTFELAAGLARVLGHADTAARWTRLGATK